MACRRWISCGKRIISFFVLLVFCTCIIFVSINRPKEVKAEPITGAVVITGAILAFLAACGVELTSSDMDTTTLQQCVEDMTADYTYDNHTGASSWYADAGTVANIISGGNAGDKTVIIGSAFSQWLQGLPAHLEQKYSLSSSGNSSVYSDRVISLFSGDYPIYVGDTVSSLQPSLISSADGSSVTVSVTSTQYFTLSVSSGRLYYSIYDNGNLTYSNWRSFDTSYPMSAFLWNLHTWSGGYSHNSLAIGFTRGNLETFSLYTLQLDIGDYPIESMSLEGSLVDGYQDLQDAMDEALGRIANNVDGVVGVNVGALDGAITADDAWERILADTIDNSLSGELTGSYEDEDEAKEELKQTDMPATGDLTGNIVVIDGLEDFFPFCIPFDLYEIISLLNVSPVAPKFEWTMNFAGIFDDYDIEIDLSDWETVARVFRVMVVIGFAVFLILKTRDLIRG